MKRLFHPDHLHKYFLIAMAFLIAAITVFTFIEMLGEYTKEDINITLRDASDNLMQLINLKVKEQWNILTTIAYCSGEQDDMLNCADLENIMHDIESTSDYDLLFSADKHGDAMASNGEIINVSDRYYYQNALWGNNNVSDVIKNRFTGEEVVVFATPVKNDNIVVGVVCASLPIKEVSKLLQVSFFNGKGNAYIISENGDIIIGSLTGVNNKNFFDHLKDTRLAGELTVEELQISINNGGEGIFTYDTSPTSKIACYKPLGLNGWHLICEVPDIVVKEQEKEMRGIAMFLYFGLAIASCLILILLIISERERKHALEQRNRELTLNDNRFRLLSYLTKDMIFEWDVEKKTIIFPNGYSHLVDYIPISSNFPEEAVNHKHIHPDDAEAFLDMHRHIPEYAKKISGDFRLKLGKDYIWTRFEELLLRNESGKIIKTIGRIEDIDSHKKDLLSLKAKVQIDGGSGLYNKRATEILIKECLKKDGDRRHALLVLDIDNFKEINDTKGHLYGDEMISRAGSLMKEFFRSSDIIGRVGGDEFMVLIRDIPGERFIEAKLDNMDRMLQKQVDICFSIGIAIYPDDGVDFIQLYENADYAMYQAKAMKNKNYCFYSKLDSSIKIQH